MLKYNPYLRPIARRLRHDMTDAEQLLWMHLRKKQIAGVRFYRQKPIGPYVVDFYAPSVRLVIEVDGAQHFETAGREQDAYRDESLAQLDLKILRFDNRQVLCELQSVLQKIFESVSRG